jgi:hypothetical protein
VIDRTPENTPVVAHGGLDGGRGWLLHADGDAADLAWFLSAVDEDGHVRGAHGYPGGPALAGRPVYLSGSGPGDGAVVVWILVAPADAVSASLVVTGGERTMPPIPQDAVPDVRFFLVEAPRGDVVGARARSAAGQVLGETWRAR